MNEESRIYWFSPDPSDVHFHEGEFGLAGLLLGLAVYNSVILDLHLPLALYKKLMDIPVGLSDLQQLDPSLANGLEHLLQLDEDDFAAIGRTFQIDVESVGEIYSIDLKPDGSTIPLTKDNCRGKTEEKQSQPIYNACRICGPVCAIHPDPLRREAVQCVSTRL